MSAPQLGKLALLLLASWIALPATGASADAQSGPPPTDIYLAPLLVTRTSVAVGRAVNVTARPGYDNQPTFTRDGRSILFASIRADGQADIYQLDVEKHTVARVTATPESEYSPAIHGDGDRFSVVRVERDSAQRVWSFRRNGGDPRLVLDSVKPVGYHAWVDEHTLALFVLGAPTTLRIADTRSGRSLVLARNIGRSLAPVTPRRFSYLQLGEDSIATLMEVRADSTTGQWMSERLVAMPRGSEYVAWIDEERAVASLGSRLLLWRRGIPEWRQVADLSGSGLRGISRLAVSPDHRWIAIVALDNPGAKSR